MSSGVMTLAALNPLDHVVNHAFITVDGWWVWSAHIGNLFLSTLICLLILPRLARGVGTGPESEGNDRYLPKGIVSHLFEVICIYLRDQVVRPLLGEKTDKYMPYLWSLFFFILINNLLGLVPLYDILMPAGEALGLGWMSEHRSPLGGTATGNLYVNAPLASISLAVYFVSGIRSLGVNGFFSHMTGGAPPMVWPILVPIELAGTFIIKPAALTIRLFANMTAGHVLLATMFIFVTMSFWGLGVIGWVPISLASVAAAIAFYFLEVFVAFLQAFIFMFLTAIFTSQFLHHGGHEHEQEHGHGVPAHA